MSKHTTTHVQCHRPHSFERVEVGDLFVHADRLWLKVSAVKARLITASEDALTRFDPTVRVEAAS